MMHNFMNGLLGFILMSIIKTSNGFQHLKMTYYKIRGIPCYVLVDHKFGEKMCYRRDKE